MIGAPARLFGPVLGFVRWWIEELAGLIPARLRLSSHYSEQLVLLFENEVGTFLLEDGRNATTLGTITLDGQPDRTAQLHDILRRHRILRALTHGKIGICLRMPASRALRTTLDLPAASESNLREVVGYELDRHTPFRPDQVKYACRVAERDALARRLKIDLAVVPLTIIDDMLQTSARLGLEPDRIEVAAAMPGAPPSEDLLAHDVKSTTSGTSKLTYGLAAAAVALIAAAVVIPLHAMQQRAEALEAEFDTVKKKAAMLGKLQKEIDSLREEEAFLGERKRRTPTASRLLFDMTRVLPDETWLTEFQISGSEVQIIGFTVSASALIGLLEQSHTFRDTTFRSPVTRDLRAERERFHIAAHVADTGQ